MEDGGSAATIILVLLVLIDMLYYGFNSAVDQLNVKEIEKRAEEEKDRRSIRLFKIMDDPAVYANTMQWIIMLIHIVIGFFCMGRWVQQVSGWLEHLNNVVLSSEIPPQTISAAAVVLTFAAVLYILLTFGVVLPKRIVMGNPVRWAYAFADIIYIVRGIMTPFVGLSQLTVRGILHLLGLNSIKDDNDVTEEEIIHMVNEGHEQGLIQASEAEMISNIFEYRDKEAQDIMTHRNNIIALDGNMLLKDAVDFVINGIQSRYPVYEENIDHIIGILHLKDILRYHADNDKQNQPLCSIKDLLREPEFVPLTRNIDELFKDMQSKKMQMVIVIDEYGQTAGLVAMEDILEEIVGNIMDEYDEENDYIEEKGNDEYVIEGKTPLEELEERFCITFDETEFETLNGYMISKMDKIPDENEQFEMQVGGYHFKILSVSNKMIHSVLVTKLPEQEAESNEENTLEE